MGEQIIRAGQTLGKVFLAAALGQFIALGQGIFDIPVDGWKNIAAAGIAAVAVTAFNWLDPHDTRYGRGATDGGAE